MRTTRRAGALLLVGVMAVASACGSDGDTTTLSSDPRAAEIVDVLKADDEFPMTDSEANCAANNMVNNLDDQTIDLMLENTTMDIDEMPNPQDAVTAIDALLDCVDLENMMVESMVQDGTPEDSARCVAENFGEDELRDFIRAAALPEDQIDESIAFEIMGKMFEIAEECGLA